MLLVRVIKLVVPKASGVILNVNSGAGKAGFSNLSAYCAGKFQLLGLAESLALGVREYWNIRVLTIFLGDVATKMWQEYDFRYYQKIRAECFSLMMWQKKLLKCYLILRPTKTGIHLKCTAMIFESTWIDR